jgi:hypothetical protein
MRAGDVSLVSGDHIAAQAAQDSLPHKGAEAGPSLVTAAAAPAAAETEAATAWWRERAAALEEVCGQPAHALCRQQHPLDREKPNQMDHTAHHGCRHCIKHAGKGMDCGNSCGVVTVYVTMTAAMQLLWLCAISLRCARSALSWMAFVHSWVRCWRLHASLHKSGCRQAPHWAGAT